MRDVGSSRSLLFVWVSSGFVRGLVLLARDRRVHEDDVAVTVENLVVLVDLNGLPETVSSNALGEFMSAFVGKGMCENLRVDVVWLQAVDGNSLCVHSILSVGECVAGDMVC